MAGWELKEGKYKKEDINKEEMLRLVKKVMGEGIHRTSPYKFIFFEALLDNLENVGANLEITFEQVYASFARVYFNKYKIYHRAIHDGNSESKKNELEQVMDEYLEQGNYETLDKEKQIQLMRRAEKVGTKYVIGAFFADSEEKFYSFSKQEKLLYFNPSVYDMLKRYKNQIKRANNYRWNRYLEKNLEIEQVDSWSRPRCVEGLIGRKQIDKSIVLKGETGIPKGFCPYFKQAQELEQITLPGESNSMEIVLEYEGRVYAGQIRKRTTGQVALIIKTKELRDTIQSVFERSKQYIVERQVEGRKLEITVPIQYAEYIEFYECKEQEDTYRIVLSTDQIGEDVEIREGEEVSMNKEAKVLQDTDIVDHITYIHNYIKAKGFTYSYETLANLYLSLKTKPFAILAGISGTGKSKIIELFAEALGATAANGRYNLIAVRPDWSDSTDLLGYRDLNNTFHPGILTTVLERAAAEPNQMYFVCLDEMNLARVEYYFSDFLAIIESRKWQEGQVVTYPILQESVLGKDESVRSKYGALGIPDNVYIIGTVNMDETTFPFSKKVLDRASTIEFSEVSLDYDFDTIEVAKEEVACVDNAFLRSEYIQMQACSDYKDVAKRIIAELTEVNQILTPIQMHFAYRVRDEIVFYMIYNERFSLVSEQEAFDLQLLQKVLPRISGTTEGVRDTLEKLSKWCEGRYEKTASKLQFMIERYDQDGFTSYWM